MPFPRPDDESRRWFDGVLPYDPRIQVKPMFGNLAAFVNRNMFLGAFGADVFVRLPQADRNELLSEDGASAFEPMKGRR